MFALTEDNFTTWAASPDIFSASHSSWRVDPDASSSIVGFQYLYCPEAADDSYTCYKFNPTSDEQADGSPRFDASTTVTAYFLDGGDFSVVSETVELESTDESDGAKMLIAGAATLAALLMSF